ncbi:MAG: DsbE family thiol:disulfide interchange protein, partial [SAR116 cluster bacterium]|nr:DsbE family thiol:disulfide interchange protein [SAR116 cluster bacterium]
MRKLIFFIPLISISVLIFMIGAALIKQNNFNDKKTVKSVFIDKHFPKESIRLLNSSQIINLNNFKGSSFLVNFFSSWCEPCKLEAENLEKLSDKINIIGIAYKDKSDDISKFLNN